MKEMCSVLIFMLLRITASNKSLLVSCRYFYDTRNVTNCTKLVITILAHRCGHVFPHNKSLFGGAKAAQFCASWSQLQISTFSPTFLHPHNFMFTHCTATTLRLS